MKPKMLTCVLMALGYLYGADISIGIRIGPPPRPSIVAVRPASPGPDWVWVDGYWYPGARWVGPHHDGERFFEGYWEGDRGHYRHDHRWDRDRDRDFDRERRGRDHDR